MKKISKRAVLMAFALAIVGIAGCTTQKSAYAPPITQDTAATAQLEHGWLYQPAAWGR